MFKIEDIIDRILGRYNNILPKKEVSSFELGKLIGHQEVIQFLREFELSLTKPKK